MGKPSISLRDVKVLALPWGRMPGTWPVMLEASTVLALVEAVEAALIERRASHGPTTDRAYDDARARLDGALARFSFDTGEGT